MYCTVFSLPISLQMGAIIDSFHCCNFFIFQNVFESENVMFRSDLPKFDKYLAICYFSVYNTDHIKCYASVISLHSGVIKTHCTLWSRFSSSVANIPRTASCYCICGSGQNRTAAHQDTCAFSTGLSRITASIRHSCCAVMSHAFR